MNEASLILMGFASLFVDTHTLYLAQEEAQDLFWSSASRVRRVVKIWILLRLARACQYQASMNLKMNKNQWDKKERIAGNVFIGLTLLSRGNTK
mmetsp:Transcript_7714/g.16097  ORF Transcript_7714/g.16097 Transcript_7714/m.16097 type:complete len:94 (-) Transcript_7714:166-447(-)